MKTKVYLQLNNEWMNAKPVVNISSEIVSTQNRKKKKTEK